MGSQGMSADQWLAAASERRTVYAVKGTSKVSDKRVTEIAEKILSFSPSSYNSQPGRISLAFGDKHKDVWNTVLEHAEPILKGAGEEVWKTMKGMFEMHKAGYGSVRSWALDHARA